MMESDDLGVLVTFRGTAVEHFKVPPGATQSQVKEAILEYFPNIEPDSEVEFEWDLSEDVLNVEYYLDSQKNEVVRRSEIVVEFEVTPQNEEAFRQILKDTGDVDEDDLEDLEIGELNLKNFFEFALSNQSCRELPEGYEFIEQDEFRDSEVHFGEIVL
jgi:hypothetical protein